jgi:hypothetical protein
MASVRILIIVTLLFLVKVIHAQVVGLVAQEVENEGRVTGKTWRIYAELTNAGDQVFVVFGDTAHHLNIESTKPFFQSQAGGPLSKDSNRKVATEDFKLKYDSWVTIGVEDNYNNSMNTLNMDFTAFEEKGGAIDSGKEGAWFCLPTDKQGACGDDKRVLIMQLTTEGKINGVLSIMGKTKDGVSYTKHDLTFQCNK